MRFLDRAAVWFYLAFMGLLIGLVIVAHVMFAVESPAMFGVYAVTILGGLSTVWIDRRRLKMPWEK